MSTIASLMVRIGADISNLQRNLQRASRSIKSAGENMKNAGRSMSLGVTLPIVGIGVAAVATMTKFDDAMARVRAISGATGDTFAKLKQQAELLGATTKFSATEAANGQEFLARAGFKAEDILSAMPGVLNLAAASATDLGTAADIASNIMGGFAMNANQATKMADILAKTTASSNTNMQQLGDAMKYAAPVAHAAGISIQETAAAIGIMSNKGIQGQKAGTAIRGGLTRLLNPAKSAKNIINKLGLSIVDSSGKMRSIASIISQLNDKTKNMTKSQKAQIAAVLFGKNSMSGWLALISEGPKSLSKFTNSLKHSQGTAKKQADIMNNSLGGAFRQLLSRLQALAISFESTLKPPITKAADYIGKLSKQFSHLSPHTKRMVVLIAGIAAAIGPFLVILGMMTSGVAALGSIMAFLITPVGATIAIIGLLVAAFIFAYMKIAWFRDGVNKVFTKVKDIVMQMLGSAMKFIKKELAVMQTWWSSHGQSIITIVKTLFNILKPIFKVAFGLIKTIVIGTWNNIKGMISGAINVILGIIGFFADLLTGKWSKLWGDIKQIFSGLWQFLLNYVELVLLGKILGAIGGFIGKGATMFSEFVNKIIGYVVHMGSNVRGAVSRVADSFLNMVSWIRRPLSGLYHIITSPFRDAWNFIKSIPSWIKNVFEKIKIRIPHFKLPHVSFHVNWHKVGPISVPTPDIGVNWYAKGGLFNGPSVIGIGESGPEAAIPLSGMRMKPFAKAIASQMPISSYRSQPDVHVHVYLDGEELSGHVGERIMDEIRLSTGTK